MKMLRFRLVGIPKTNSHLATQNTVLKKTSVNFNTTSGLIMVFKRNGLTFTMTLIHGKHIMVYIIN